jgi:hypothetical protein
VARRFFSNGRRNKFHNPIRIAYVHDRLYEPSDDALCIVFRSAVTIVHEQAYYRASYGAVRRLVHRTPGLVEG